MPPKKPVDGEATPSLAAILANLAPRRSRIDAADKQLIEALQVIEEKFRGLISTRVHTVIGTSDAPGDDMWCERLAFGKWDGKWQFIVESGEIDDETTWKMQALITAPKEMRVRAFSERWIERLIREAANQLDEQILERENAMKAANGVLHALEAAANVPF